MLEVIIKVFINQEVNAKGLKYIFLTDFIRIIYSEMLKTFFFETLNDDIVSLNPIM